MKNSETETEAEKEKKYKTLVSQISSVVSVQDHFISNLANICSLIKECFDFHWVGFYLASKTTKELFLGPFQGPVACTRIKYGQGVCGAAWEGQKTIVVDDVHQFKGHIACSEKTNSEIVLPFSIDDEFVGVLDIDSVNFKDFNEIDVKYLGQIIDHLIDCSNCDKQKREIP